MARAPVLFVSHGGGPLPLLADPGHERLSAHLAGLAAQFDEPDAIVVVSAHWEAPQASITVGGAPGLIYDYFGFPPAAYRITYPAPGHPDLARRLETLLQQHGVPAGCVDRGWDHGVFVPLALIYPQAGIPVVQLSLLASLDAGAHITLGEALAPLREENVLVLGSGSSFHNMQSFFGAEGLEESIAFSEWLVDCVCGAGRTYRQRAERLAQWPSAPYGRFCHPRPEHLLPLMVCLGAGRGSQPAQCLFSDRVLGRQMVSFGWPG